LSAQLHGDTPPRHAGYTAWRSVVSFDTDRIRASESLGFGARFGQVPMSGRVYWFATENAPEGGRHPDEQAHLRALFRDWHQPSRALIEAADPRRFCEPTSTIVRHCGGRGRATLLGDAAHAMTPNLGQGGCQAIEDAVVLARCLRQHADPVEALRTYEARRIPRTSAVPARGSRRPVEPAAGGSSEKHADEAGHQRLQTRGLEAVVGYRV
jgi:2-polyprenyl-6-methoxyphenol hydroxylase-like FAD-dependent oxidoreductase